MSVSDSTPGGEHLQALFDRLKSGDLAARNPFWAFVNDRLRGMSAAFMRKRLPESSVLQATGFVNDFAAELSHTLEEVPTLNHFWSYAAVTMNRDMIDAYRNRKRRHDAIPTVSIIDSDADAPESSTMAGYLEVHDALETLKHLNPDGKPGLLLALVAALRLFAGLSSAEIADILDVSPRTVDSLWAAARNWLKTTFAPV